MEPRLTACVALCCNRVSRWCCRRRLSSAFAQADIADAAMRRDTAEIARLLKSGADVNAQQGDGATALHWAAYRGDASWPIAAARRPAPTSGVANRNGATPLWLAATRAMRRDRGIAQGRCRCQRAAAARPPPADAGRTLGHVDAVRALLDGGADVNASENERGTTALMQAADQGHADVLKC